jgi:hypothetical protein
LFYFEGDQIFSDKNLSASIREKEFLKSFIFLKNCNYEKQYIHEGVVHNTNLLRWFITKQKFIKAFFQKQRSDQEETQEDYYLFFKEFPEFQILQDYSLGFIIQKWTLRLFQIFRNLEQPLSIKWFCTPEYCYVLLAQYLYKLHFNDHILENILADLGKVDFNSQTGICTFEDMQYKIEKKDEHIIINHHQKK